MNIYLGNTTDFNNNGLGFLTDCLLAKVTEELNGGYNLSISYPLNSNMSQYLIENNIIKCNVGNDNYQLFRIKEIEKDFTTMKVYATHIFYDLSDNFIEDTAPTNLDCESFCNWFLSKTTFSNNFEAISDISGVKSARYVRRNPVDCFLGDTENSVVKLFGAELERDNFKIKLLSRRGSDNNVKLIFGKNIKNISIIIDITSLYTKIMPLGYDGLMLPEKYVDSPLINLYPTPKIAKIEFSNIKYDPEDEEAYQTLDEAYEALRNATNELFENGIDKSMINIKIDWLELSKTKEYYDMYSSIEKVNLGDTLIVELAGLNYTTRVIKTEYNPLTDTIEKYEIGTACPSFQKTMNEVIETSKEINPSNILADAKSEATRLITTAMGGYVYKTTNKIFIMDNQDPDVAQKIWRWNLNGLGYSKTGINGEYGIAITQDGSIVADFITSGTINTNLIEGYDSLILQVDNNNKSVNQIITNSFTKTQIQSILRGEEIDGTVVEVVKNKLITEDENGTTWDSDQSKVKTNVDADGLEIIDKQNNDEVILEAKYDNTIGETVVKGKRIIVENYLVVGTHSRFEDYENGTGCFYLQ